MFNSQIKNHNLCFSTRHAIVALFSGHASISASQIFFKVFVHVHKRTLNVWLRAEVILKYQILHNLRRISDIKLVSLSSTSIAINVPFKVFFCL